MQWPAIVSAFDLVVGLGGLLQRQVLGQGDDREQFGRVFLQALEVHFGQVGGGNFSCFDQRSQGRDWFESQILDGAESLGTLLSGREFCRLHLRLGGIKSSGRFGVERHIDLAQFLIAVERPIQAREHHGFLLFGKIEANQLEGVM